MTMCRFCENSNVTLCVFIHRKVLQRFSVIANHCNCSYECRAIRVNQFCKSIPINDLWSLLFEHYRFAERTIIILCVMHKHTCNLTSYTYFCRAIGLLLELCLGRILTLPIKCWITFKVLLIVYKCVNELAPKYFLSCLEIALINFVISHFEFMFISVITCLACMHN